MRSFRLTAVLFLLLASAFAHAQTADVKDFVEGIVTTVNPATRTLTIAGGQIVIDGSTATVAGPRPNFDFASILPGSQVSIFLETTPQTPGALKAKSITVVQLPNTLLTGRVQAIDLTARTFTLLGLTIHVDDKTVFTGGLPGSDPHSLAELKVNDPVYVTLDGSTSILNAALVRLATPPPQQTVIFRATLLAKNGDIWTVSANQFGSTVHVTSSTVIEGNPEPGTSLLEIHARIDSGVITALSIKVVGFVTPPPSNNPTFLVTGVLKERTATSLTVDNALTLMVIKIAGETKFVGDPQVGDNVDVTVRRVNNELIAVVVAKRTTSITMMVVGVLNAINGNDWSVGPWHFIVNDSTVISGAPKVGDQVRVLAERQPNGAFIAKTIDKVTK